MARMYSENPKVIYVMFSYMAGVEDSEAFIAPCIHNTYIPDRNTITLT